MFSLVLLLLGVLIYKKNVIFELDFLYDFTAFVIGLHIHK